MMLGYNMDTSEKTFKRNVVLSLFQNPLLVDLLASTFIVLKSSLLFMTCTLHNCCTWFDFIGVWWRLSAGACVMSGPLCVSDPVSKSLPERTLGVSGGLPQESHPQRFYRGHGSGISLSGHMETMEWFQVSEMEQNDDSLKMYNLRHNMPAVQ